MANILKVLYSPNKILREKSSVVNSEMLAGTEFKQLLKDMTLTMLEKDGVGLAAPQIGKTIRLTIIKTKDGPIAFINPEIIKKSWAKEWGEEGCLSVPNVFGLVRRHKKITCRYQDKLGKKKVIEAKGIMARILQHEIDHLEGVLFIDKAKEIKKIA
ncbi:peptide deformylase [bacterium]|nr:peptide deformylase [bacterium]